MIAGVCGDVSFTLSIFSSLFLPYHYSNRITLFSVVPFVLRKNLASPSVQNMHLNLFLTFREIS